VPRPSKATAPVVERIETELARGTTLKQAAAHAGISERTLRGWLSRGVVTRRTLRAVPDPEPVTGSGAVNDERLEEAAVLGIIKAFSGDWRSCAWFLERAFPEKWGRPA
jgi:transposase